MRDKVKTHFLCIFPAAKKWWRDRHADDAAALAFYSLISLVPLLVISVWVASLLVDTECLSCAHGGGLASCSNVSTK